MMDSSSASARDRSSVVIVEGFAFRLRTRSSISSMSARRTRFALRSPAWSDVEMTVPPLEPVYLSPGGGFRPVTDEYTCRLAVGERRAGVPGESGG